MTPPYRTTPPPAHGPLVVWACREAAAWPGTPQGVYTWWVRYVEGRRKAPKQHDMFKETRA